MEQIGRAVEYLPPNNPNDIRSSQGEEDTPLRDLFRGQLERGILGYLVNTPAVNEANSVKFQFVSVLEKVNFADHTNRAIYESCVKMLVQQGDSNMVNVGLDVPPFAAVAVTDLPYQVSGLVARKQVEKLVMLSQVGRIYDLYCEGKRAVEGGGLDGHLKTIEEFMHEETSKQRQDVDLAGVASNLIAEWGISKRAGFDWLEEVPSMRLRTGGIEPGKLYVLGGVKKTGKTRLAVAVMKRLMEQGEIPLFLSMEMKEQEVLKLFLASYTGINSAAFHHRPWFGEKEKMFAALDKFMDRIKIDCDGFLSLEQLRGKLANASAQGSRIAVIDYLQRMNFPDTKGKNWATTIADSVARIADMARDYGVAVILLSQLRNEAENEEIADMRFLKDSGGIAEAADCVIVMTNKRRQKKGMDKYDTDERDNLLLSIEQRSGETTLITCTADLGHLRFEQTAVLPPLRESEIERTDPPPDNRQSDAL